MQKRVGKIIFITLCPPNPPVYTPIRPRPCLHDLRGFKPIDYNGLRGLLEMAGHHNFSFFNFVDDADPGPDGK
jgi:hypothetical protein